MRHPAAVILMCGLVILATTALATDTEALLSRARQFLGEGKLRNGLAAIDQVLADDPDHPAALSLKGACLLAYGDAAVLDIVDRLRDLGHAADADLLQLKVMLFLGEPGLPAVLAELQDRTPDCPELALVQWLHRLDRGEFDWASTRLDAVAAGAALSYIPHLAAYHHACDRSDSLAIAYLDRLHSATAWDFATTAHKLAARLDHPPRIAVEGAAALEFAWCGSQAGFAMTDSRGERIKVSLDTGTGNRLFTIHHRDVGDRLGGERLAILEKAIQFNYMDAPADVVIKAVDFARPPVRSLNVEYFAGGFSLADGCCSPFAFPDVAIVMDPVNEQATMHDQRSFERWLASLPTERVTIVPCILRNSWPFIPCRIDGRDCLMMVESGSRDVNVNEVAARAFGLVPYDGTIEWKGADYPVRKADFTLEVGSMVHHIEGGQVTDWVLGNHFYGMAGAGDIGPGFLNRFAYAFDPWQRRLILVEPAPRSRMRDHLTDRERTTRGPEPGPDPL